MMNDESKVWLFAYGTLQRGEHNHRVIQRATYVFEARTAPRFTLYDLGPFPALVAEGSTSVLGEVYEVDADMMKRLDQLEGAPRLYQRVAVELDDGALVQAYVQRLDQVLRRRKIASGSWREHRREQRCALG